MIGALLRRYWSQLLVIAVIGVLAFFVNHYRDNAITYKDQRDKASVRAETSEAITNNMITTICRPGSVMWLHWMPNTRRN